MQYSIVGNEHNGFKSTEIECIYSRIRGNDQLQGKQWIETGNWAHLRVLVVVVGLGMGGNWKIIISFHKIHFSTSMTYISCCQASNYALELCKAFSHISSHINENNWHDCSFFLFSLCLSFQWLCMHTMDP